MRRRLALDGKSLCALCTAQPYRCVAGKLALCRPRMILYIALISVCFESELKGFLGLKNLRQSRNADCQAWVRRLSQTSSV